MLRRPPHDLVRVWGPWIRELILRANRIPPVGLVQLTSWFRTPDENAAVFGDQESQHLLGLAFDVAGPDDALRRAFAGALEAGLIPVKETDHLHVQLFRAGVLGKAGVLFPTSSSSLAN